MGISIVAAKLPDEFPLFSQTVRVDLGALATQASSETTTRPEHRATNLG